MKEVVKILLFVAIANFSLSVTNAQCLSGWTYYMPVVVVNQTSAGYINMQVNISVNTASLIGAGKMNSSGDDIRFVDSGTCNTIPYYIESGINTSATSIWLKMPKLPANAHRTIKMYYGNASASAASDGDSVFILYDDFSGSSLSSAKWNSYSSNASYSLSGGKISFSAGSGSSTVGTCVIVSTASYSSPIIVEAMVTSASGFYSSLGMLNSGTWNGYSMYVGDATAGVNKGMHIGQDYANSVDYGAYIKTTNASPGTVTGLWQMYWPSTGSQTAVWPGGSSTAALSTISLGSSVQVTAGNLWTSFGSTTFDWIRARKFISADAKSTIGNEVYNNTLVVSPVSGSPFCTSSAISIDIPFTVSGNITFNSNNVFTAQLSDSSGSFSNPVNIGSLTSTTPDTIKATIPSGKFGLHFRIRIVNSTNSQYNSPPSASVLVISSNPVAGLSVNASDQCLSDNSFAFTNSSSGSGTMSYSWNFGDGNSSTTINPVYTYSVPGKYNVKLTATNNAGCYDTASKNIIINSAVAAFAVNNAKQCFGGNSFVFTNKSSGYGTLSYKWDFGDGNFSTTSNETHVFAASGTFKVKLFATSDNNCIDSSEVSLTVYPRVFADFKVNNENQCFNNQNFLFTDNSTISSGSINYNWNFGDGTSFSALQNPIHSYLTAGTYTVKLTTFSDKGCFDTVSKLVTVYPSPGATAKANGPTAFCQGDNVGFSANFGSAFAYQWLKNGSKITFSGTGSNYTATSSGSYRVVVSTGNGCSDTSNSIKVIVNPIPSKPVITQQGRMLSSTTAFDYQWSLNGAAINGANSSSYYPAVKTGIFSVTISDSNGCTNTSDPYNYDVTGIEGILIYKTIPIYPNPANDVLHIDLSGAGRGFDHLLLTDIQGKLLTDINVSGRHDVVILKLNNIKGIYYIRLIGKYGTSIEKFVVN